MATRTEMGSKGHARMWEQFSLGALPQRPNMMVCLVKRCAIGDQKGRWVVFGREEKVWMKRRCHTSNRRHI